jgi:hypothetical protein
MPEPLPLLWSPWSAHVALVLRTLGVSDPETGEVISPRRVDDAFQLVMEEMRLREGWASVPSLDRDKHLRAHVIGEVARVLGVESVPITDLNITSETRWVLGEGADLRVVDARFVRDAINHGARLQERLAILSDWTDLS